MNRNLTHQELADVLRVTMRAGKLLLQNGAASFRTEEAMSRLAQKMGVETLASYVTPTGIISTAYSGAEHRTQIVRINRLSVDMNRMIALEVLSRRPESTLPEYLEAELDKIEAKTALYPPLLVMLMVGIACGPFAFALGGGLTEFLAASIAAFVAQGVRLRMNKAGMTLIPVTTVCAALATLISVLLVRYVFHSPQPQWGVIASVLLLVPGVPLVTAIIDLIRFDLVSGLSRGALALMIFACIAIGMVCALALTGFDILGTSAVQTPITIPFILLQALSGFAITFGFAILFNVPRNMLLSCGIIGATGHLARTLLRSVGIANEVATFTGALIVGLYGYYRARQLHMPRMVFTLTGIISMVPGVPAYEMVVLFSNSKILDGLQSGVRAALLTGAITAGLSAARLFTDREEHKT